MLKRISDLPPGLDGVEAVGKVTIDDYHSVLTPLLADAHRSGRRVRFLYHLGGGFEGFTPGAALEDFRVGMKYLRLFDRCAVVSDKDWILHASRLMGPLVPCPFKAFPETQFKDAVAWLSSPGQLTNLVPTLIPEKNSIVIEVKGALSREGFELLSAELDPWIEKHQGLRGLVIHVKHFPGWDNFGSLVKHLEFVREHHRKVKRVALSADGLIPELMPKIANHFVEAEVRHFSYDELENALAWAGE